MTKKDSPINNLISIANARRKRKPPEPVPSFIDFCREMSPQCLWIDFPEPIDWMIAMVKIIDEATPEQQQISAMLSCNPSLEWLVINRRRQFEFLALLYAMAPADEKDKFIERHKGWWRLWKANEDRAEAHLAEHRRRGGAA
jgi:hypothetical protein